MTATRQHPTAKEAGETGLGAIGSHGGWSVSIDEATSGRSGLVLEIDGPSAYLQIPIESPEIVGKMLAHLTQARQLHEPDSILEAEFKITGPKTDEVALVKDSEFPDRCFLIVQTKAKTVVRITVGGADWHAFLRALKDLAEECDA